MEVQRVIPHVHKTFCLRSSSLLTLGMSMVQRRQMEALSRGYDTVMNVWTVWGSVCLQCSLPIQPVARTMPFATSSDSYIVVPTPGNLLFLMEYLDTVSP